MKKSILAVIAILILLMIGVLIWNANEQAVNNEPTPVTEDVDQDAEQTDDDETATDTDTSTEDDTTDGTGIDDEPEVSAEENIRVTSPDDGQKVSAMGLTIVGEARVFENSVQWRVKDAAGTVLDEGVVTADASDIGEYGWFVAYAHYLTSENTAGTVEVYSLSARDGAEQDMVTIPVRFVPVREAQVYLSNGATGEECGDVVAADRFIPAGVSRQYAMVSVLWALLEGATGEEAADDLESVIPEGVRINDLRITGNTVTVDFSGEIDAGGSCRVIGIRAEVEQTLKQFDGITNVVITVDGGSADEALQP